MHDHVSVVIEKRGEPSPPERGLSADAVAERFRRLHGARDATMAISPEGSTERLIVAVDGLHAVLGWEREDGLLQFVCANPDLTVPARPLTIGRQEADIESCYLLDVAAATEVIRAWLNGAEPVAQGRWEHR